jgi:hypothetical protein
MFDETVTSEIVNPTDCVLTSQNETSRPQVLERGRYAVHAAATVHMIFAAVAVSRREFGTLRVIAPPIMRAMIWIASPTDLSWVVLVVLNPYTYS